MLFHNDEEFKTAMNVVAFASFIFSDLKIFTFEIMDNHFHFSLAGSRDRIKLFLRMLVLKLSVNPLLKESSADLKHLVFKIYSIDNLNLMRNVIAYVNRNGAVVDPNENVFTYRWGANRFFFNREARLRFESCGTSLTSRQKREMFHSDLLAKEDAVTVLDGYVFPLCFCYIKEAESMFRNCRHYFYCVSRNVEASTEVAKSIGESLFYTDEDLFAHISVLCSKRYGERSIATLPKDAKLEIAKELHFNL